MNRQLQTRRLATIFPGMILSRLFALLIALSLPFGPLAMNQAMAAAPATSHSQMTEGNHCQTAGKGKTDKAMPKPCCAAMCATAAMLPQALANAPLFDRVLASPAPARSHRGVLSEIATPPPRVA